VIRCFVALGLLAVDAHAAPQKLVADVNYNFIDQNGFGWAVVEGKVTVTLTFKDKDGSLDITGTRRWVDGKVTGAGGMDTSNKWEGKADASYPLRDVVRTGSTITFKLDPIHDKLEGNCAPTKQITVASTTLYECTFTGFKWKTIAQLPELHHPIVLDANPAAKLRVVNAMNGKAKAGFGQRALTTIKPPKK
jgi:hypothetical protein